MNFGEIFNKAFLDGFSNTDIGFMEMAMVFALAVILGGYIYLVYRFVSRQAFYSKQFNVSLAILPVIVAARNAGNILKSGTFVTIDAEQGIVYSGK